MCSEFEAAKRIFRYNRLVREAGREQMSHGYFTFLKLDAYVYLVESEHTLSVGRQGVTGVKLPLWLYACQRIILSDCCRCRSIKPTLKAKKEAARDNSCRLSIQILFKKSYKKIL